MAGGSSLKRGEIKLHGRGKGLYTLPVGTRPLRRDEIAKFG